MQKRHTTTAANISCISKVLAIGDALALCAFLVIGEIQHGLLGSPDLLLNVIKQLAAFSVTWFVLAWALGALTIQIPFDAWRFLSRSLLAWLFAAPAGVVLRAVLMGQAATVMPFVFAATGFGGLILLGWRAIYTLVRQRLHRPRIASAPAGQPRVNLR